MSESVVDARPSGAAVGVATAAALVAALPLAVTPLSLPLGLSGVLLLASGTATGSERGATVGVGALLAGVVVAGLGGAGAATLLFATGASVVAWDAAAQAIDLGATLGRAADAPRPLAVHVAATAGLVAAAAALGYVTFRLSAGGRPLLALVLLLVGALALAAALRA
ncbi:DUF7519 family protein [Halomarina pelagica]|uniref:DUF7519 family protein n=1 Tax=Halomarina pelagica TaxID=2961599 RepID=UPI0020C1F49F|nr:hypothetical protein [Halomarina sp. BND7]